MQSGGDVFVYDLCWSKRPRRIRMYSCEDNSLKFDEINNDEYEVGITLCSILSFRLSSSLCTCTFIIKLDS